MGKNKNIIFLHIPKNGGTTFKTIISRNFSRKSIFEIKELSPTERNINEFLSMSELDRKRIKLLMGHMMFGHHKNMFGSTDYITFLRKPIDRAVSNYYHIKRVKDHRMHNLVMNKNWNLNNFLLESSDGDIFNAQVRMISGIHDKSEFMLEKAIENIDNHFSFIGLQEEFDKSLIILKQLYNLKVPYYKKMNVGSKINCQVVNKKAENFINEQNEADIVLYNYCKAKFANQLKEISNLKFELNKLKICNRLYGSTKLKIINKKLNFN